jgi:methyl-accepting chemotaxis protein
LKVVFTVVLKHYAAICIALETIYVESGTKSCEAGGLLKIFRKSSSLQFLLVLRYFLQPLARLSRTLQSSSGDLATAMAVVKASVSTLRDDFNLVVIKEQCADIIKEAAAAGVRMADDGLTEKQKDAICVKYVSQTYCRKSGCPFF